MFSEEGLSGVLADHVSFLVSRNKKNVSLAYNAKVPVDDKIYLQCSSSCSGSFNILANEKFN